MPAAFGLLACSKRFTFPAYFSSMASVFITGAAGFVGKALTKALLAEGYEVHALCRQAAQAEMLQKMGAKPILGDLRQVGQWSLPVVDYVIHAAAMVGKAGSAADYRAVNAEATLNLARRCADIGIRRFVFISSYTVLFSTGHQLQMTDDLAYCEVSDPYIQSKVAAEQYLERLAGETRMQVFCLRPTIIWGEGDTVQLPLMKAAIQSGRFRWIDGGSPLLQPTYVGNLVHACIQLLAAATPAPGAYLLADAEVHRHGDFWKRLLPDVQPWPVQAMPFWMAWLIASGLAAVWRLLGIRKKPPISKVGVLSFGRSHTVSYQRAANAFGYAPKYRFDEAYRTFTFGR
jgi:nucleoside-diphosphate-sugar epimerase